MKNQAYRMALLYDFYGDMLTDRQKDVLMLLAKGAPIKRICLELNLSEGTVKTHVRHIYQKADVHDRQQFIDSVLSPDQTASPEPRDQAR